MKKRLLYQALFTLFFNVIFFFTASAQFDFALKNTDGKTVSLNNNPNAKGYIIVFTCNHCPFAKLYPKRLNQLSKKYSLLDVPLIAISSTDTIMYEEDSYEKMVAKAKSGKYNFPYLYDSAQSVARNYKAERTPQAFVIWKENDNWVVKYNGAIDDNGADPELVTEHYVANAIDELLGGNQVKQPFTRSVGCKINFRKQD
jgi:peroxiredoxin